MGNYTLVEIAEIVFFGLIGLVNVFGIKWRYSDLLVGIAALVIAVLLLVRPRKVNQG